MCESFRLQVCAITVSVQLLQRRKCSQSGSDYILLTGMKRLLLLLTLSESQTWRHESIKHSHLNNRAILGLIGLQNIHGWAELACAHTLSTKSSTSLCAILLLRSTSREHQTNHFQETDTEIHLNVCTVCVS